MRSYSICLVLILSLLCCVAQQEEDGRADTQQSQQSTVVSALYAVLHILTYPFSDIGRLVFGFQGEF